MAQFMSLVSSAERLNVTCDELLHDLRFVFDDKSKRLLAEIVEAEDGGLLVRSKGKRWSIDEVADVVEVIG